MKKIEEMNIEELKNEIQYIASIVQPILQNSLKLMRRKFMNSSKTHLMRTER